MKRSTIVFDVDRMDNSHINEFPTHTIEFWLPGNLGPRLLAVALGYIGGDIKIKRLGTESEVELSCDQCRVSSSFVLYRVIQCTIQRDT